jgi:glutathione S-transferase
MNPPGSAARNRKRLAAGQTNDRGIRGSMHERRASTARAAHRSARNDRRFVRRPSCRRVVRARIASQARQFRDAACYIPRCGGLVDQQRHATGEIIAMYTLYYSPGTASLPVHLALIELGVPHELHRVDLDAGEQNGAAYRALNPHGVVPTLIVDGQPVYESAALLMLLAERHPDKHLGPMPGTPSRPTFLQWMLHFANVVQPAFRIWFAPQDFVEAGDAKGAKDLARGRIETEWERFDAHIAAHGPFVLGDNFSVADIYATMLMRWSRNMPKPATSWPALAALAARMKARPSWRQLYAIEGLTEWA